MKMKEIARKAGVSIATVSHVVNKTRYVSDELTERVMKVIQELDEKPGFLLRNMKAASTDRILCVIENLTDYFCVEILKGVKCRAVQEGLQVVVLQSDHPGVVQDYVRLEKPSGIILITDKRRSERIRSSDFPVPMVIVGHADRIPESGHLLIDYRESAYKGTLHLIKSGHEKIGLIYDPENPYARPQILSGYQAALREHELSFDPARVLDWESDKAFEMDSVGDWEEDGLTAWVIGNEVATFEFLRYFTKRNFKIPEDLSVVSLTELEANRLVNPAITTVAHDPHELGRMSVEKLKRKIASQPDGGEDVVAPCRMTIRHSTKCIGRGPLGDKAESPECLELSAADIERIKAGSYTAAISFHYAGTAWARMHEKGIKDVFWELGIKVLAVTDAHFNPDMQITQHESILAMRPDILISIPADEAMTSHGYREIVNAGTKLVLINNVPHGFGREDYVTCVSVNERENGQVAGRILGQYLTDNGKKKVGMLVHGASFFATKQRDMAVEQVLSEEFPELEIVAMEPFIKESKAFDTCYEMIKLHPEIEGLYVSWEGPALAVLKALRELGREDIGVITADLDTEVAYNMAAGGPIKGISAQRPYDQGRAMALSAANALLGRSIPSFIGVSPDKVTSENLLAKWQEILRERAPAELAQMLKIQKPTIPAERAYAGL
uniref:LacI family DNA-binding transcriptional regulator n=2 Tax=Cohnella candidum TaxID=2674991 RepID=A0A3G3JUT6_9BACL|nr:LacI family DNA-binding transcriptional regulator [Cohnella candidum]